jgi:hypothetical protein
MPKILKRPCNLRLVSFNEWIANVNEWIAKATCDYTKCINGNDFLRDLAKCIAFEDKRGELQETASGVLLRRMKRNQKCRRFAKLGAFEETRFGKNLPVEMLGKIFDHVLPQKQRESCSKECDRLEAEARAQAVNELKNMMSGWCSLLNEMRKTNAKGTLRFFLQMLRGKSMIREDGKTYMEL